MGVNKSVYVHLVMVDVVCGTDDPPATWLVADTAGSVVAPTVVLVLVLLVIVANPGGVCVAGW